MKSQLYRVFECHEGQDRYRYVVRGRLNGTYTRKYFRKRTDAETWAEVKNIEVLNQGVEHSQFPTGLRLEAQRARNLLLPFGVSVLDAVKIALPLIESRKKSLPVKEALRRFFDDYRIHGGLKTAIPSVTYLKYLGDMLARFGSVYGERLVADVALSDIEDFLAARKNAGAVTRQAYIRAISAFYSWSVRKGFRLDNPLSKIRKKVPPAAITVLTVENARKLMQCAEDDEIGVLALALFCGLRISEFGKMVRDGRGQTHPVYLDWSDVDLKAKHVFVRPELDKNRHGRYVDVPANAISWLERVRQSMGPIMPENWRRRRELLKERSGIDLPQNVLRHSFCSYRIALDQDYSKAAAMVGNSPSMLRKHYVRVLPKSLGRAFFQIRPTTKESKGKIVQFNAA